MHAEFIGREDAMSVLKSCARQAQAGRAQLVFVEGQPGMGKTTLLAQFASTLRGWTLLTISGDESETRLPYAVADRLSWGLSSPTPTDEDAPTIRDPLTEGARLLARIGDNQDAGPVAIFLDDAPWSDPQSLAALTFMLRRLGVDKVLTVLTMRPDDIPRFPQGLQRLSHDRAEMIRLDGLDTEAVLALGRKLNHPALSRRAAERLQEHTGGNPLYLNALFTELRLDELQRADAPLPAPASFSSLVVASLDRCSDQARYLVMAAAVLGTDCSVTSAASVGNVDQPLQAVEEAVAAGLLRARRTADGWTIMFPHSMIRAAVHNDLGPNTRSQLHHRAAAFEVNQRALAHRVAAADGPDPDLVADLIERAKDEEQHGRPAAAADWLISATRFSPVEARSLILLDAVDLLIAAGEAAEAESYLPPLAASNDNPRRQLTKARLAWMAGRHTDMESLATSVWRSGTASQRAAAAGLLGHLHLLANDNPGAARWTARALNENALPPPVASNLRGVHALALCLSGHATEGLRMVRDLPDAARDTPTGRFDELLARGEIRLFTDQLEGAVEDLREFLPSQRAFGASANGLVALIYLAEAEYRSGAWDDSIAHAEQALSLILDGAQPWLSAFAHAVCVYPFAGRGQWPAARRHAEAATTEAVKLGDRASAAYASNAAVHLASAQGDQFAVIEAAIPLHAAPPGTTTHEPGVLRWRGKYAEALLATGRLDEARKVVDELGELGAQRELGSALATAARISADLASAAGDTTRARALYRELVAPVPTVNNLEVARAQLSYGRFLRRRGERRSALEHLTIAATILESLGAEPLLKTCGAELSACGSPRTAKSSPLSSATRNLTPQERAVARLVGTGLTNREAAAELIISAKTVGYHLGHVYSKLGVRSRTELAALLAQRS